MLEAQLTGKALHRDLAQCLASGPSITLVIHGVEPRCALNVERPRQPVKATRAMANRSPFEPAALRRTEHRADTSIRQVDHRYRRHEGFRLTQDLRLVELAPTLQHTLHRTHNPWHELPGLLVSSGPLAVHCTITLPKYYTFFSFFLLALLFFIFFLSFLILLHHCPYLLLVDYALMYIKRGSASAKHRLPSPLEPESLPVDLSVRFASIVVSPRRAVVALYFRSHSLLQPRLASPCVCFGLALQPARHRHCIQSTYNKPSSAHAALCRPLCSHVATTRRTLTRSEHPVLPRNLSGFASQHPSTPVSRPSDSLCLLVLGSALI